MTSNVQHTATALAANPAAATAAAISRDATSAASLPYDLKLLAASCSVEFNFVTCEGSVRNVSSRSLEHVDAVVEFSTEDGDFVTQKSDDALIDYDPLLPGQESPFKVISSYNPLLTRRRVRFKLLLDGLLNTDYSVFQQ